MEIVKDKEKILAIIVRADQIKNKLEFVTPENFPLQLGFHNRSKGEEVRPHTHKTIKELKEIPCQEMLHIKKGKIEVGIFDSKNKEVKREILKEGDTIFLNSGHEVKFLEDTEIVEVKQGPYDKYEKEFFEK